jgi:DinB superfamily
VQVIPDLQSMPGELERAFEQIPRHLRDWKPASWEGVPGETFSALEQLCHLRDIEIDGYRFRIERLLAEEEPLLVSIDGYALAVERRYAEQDPAEVLAAFRAARLRTVDILGKVRGAAWERRGAFEGYGPVNLAGLVHFLRSHDQQHLSCMHWLLGKMHSQAQTG